MSAGAIYVNSWSAAGYQSLINFGMSCDGINRALVVFIYVDSSSNVLNYCQYDSVDLTAEATIAGAGIQRIYVQSMLNPPTGTLNLITSIGGPLNFHVHAVTLEGVEQSGDPFGSVGWSENNDSSPSRSRDSNNRSIVLDSVGYIDDTIVPTVGAGQTKVEDTNIGSATRFASSWEQGVDPSVVMSWSLSSSIQWLMGAISVQGIQKKSSRALMIL